MNYNLDLFKKDFPASLIVFLVALPLCLGIALASGAPLFSGIISGIIGGIIVGAISGSHVGVSGPAAGLAVIVLSAITTMGSFEGFLVAVVVAGLIQIAMGLLKAGIIGYYFPSSVIKGMLSGIGIVIILKQIPHLFGYDSDPLGDLVFHQMDTKNTFSALAPILNHVTVNATIIGLISFAALVLWETKWIKSFAFTKIVQGPLVAVVLGTALVMLFGTSPEWAVSADHLVAIPIADGFSGFISLFTTPDWRFLSQSQTYVTAATIAVVASLETLLCVEATDKIDPEKRVTPTNRELVAQGVGNTVAGLIGGLPVTQVIVRSSANIQSGNATKASAIFHGIFLLLCVATIPAVINMVPLASLAAVLLVVGYKLAKPAVFKAQWAQGAGQFVPFVITILGIVFTDLLLGICMGLIVGFVHILWKNYNHSVETLKYDEEGAEKVEIVFSQHVTFLSKPAVQRILSELPDETDLVVNLNNVRVMAPDVIEIIEDFSVSADSRKINVQLKNNGKFAPTINLAQPTAQAA